MKNVIFKHVFLDILDRPLYRLKKILAFETVSCAFCTIFENFGTLMHIFFPLAEQGILKLISRKNIFIIF